MRRVSIRLRLIVAAVVSIAVTLAVAGVSLVNVFEHQILRRVEHELDIRWNELAASFVLDESGRPALSRSLNDPRYHQPYGGAFWQVSEGGEPVLTSRSLWDGGIDVAAAPSDGRAFESAGPEASDLYVIDRPVTLADARTFHLAVALDHADVEELSAAFGFDVLRILGPIAVILAIAAWFQLRYSLNPLRELDRELKAVHDARQPRLRDDFPSEVEPVVTDLNRLLDRQDQLIRKARDRAGVLAHGLKTPLTIIGSEARRLERLGLAESAQRINGQVDLIRRHVDRELARARTAGASAAAGAFADARDTVDRLVRLMQHLPRGEDVAFQNRLSAGLTVRMDPDDFGEVVGNLMDNARKWARSEVVVSDSRAAGGIEIVIEDDGPGFAMEGGGRRGVPGQRDDESSGLGLGIVEDILGEYRVALVVAVADGRCRVSFTAPTGEPGRAPLVASPPRQRPADENAGGMSAGAIGNLPRSA